MNTTTELDRQVNKTEELRRGMRIVGWMFLALAGFSYYKGHSPELIMVIIGMSNVWFAASAVCKAIIAAKGE